MSDKNTQELETALALAAATQRAEAAEAKLQESERDLSDMAANSNRLHAIAEQMRQRANTVVAEYSEKLVVATQRAEAAEAKLTAIPWDELHAVHMRATNKNLHDWLTVTDWLSRNTPEQQGAQP